MEDIIDADYAHPKRVLKFKTISLFVCSKRYIIVN